MRLRRPRSTASLTSYALLAAVGGSLAACSASPADEPTAAGASEVVVGAGGVSAVGNVGMQQGPSYSDRAYFFRGLGSRCFDFGGQASWAIGAPLMIYDCNGSVAQQVRVKEIDDTHDVELRVQSLYCIGVRGGSVVVDQPLELQACNGSPAQRFALDGDSVIMGYQSSGKVTREVVVEPRDDGSAARTPLVVGARDTSDAEYFRAQAVDGSTAWPTTGFVKVSTEAGLRSALGMGWGAVVEIDDAKPLALTGTISVPAGVTLRGYRKHRNPGAVLTVSPQLAADEAIEIEADDVRVTGLRVLGVGTAVNAINVDEDRSQRVLIDHDEVTGWGGSAINVAGADAPCNLYDDLPCDANHPPEAVCPTAPYDGPLAYPRPTNVRVLRSFVHDNTAYGIVTGNGAMILAQGNVEYMNQHSLSSDPWRLSGYVAYDNLLLSPNHDDSPHTSNQDFDVHGSDGVADTHYSGGISGDYFDVGWNTFLQDGHYDFDDRGTPCRFASFHDNVSVQSSDDAVTTQSTKGLPLDGNTFGAGNPTSDLAVADFDGDHVDDVFVGTGVTWWFSSGGVSEWRLLNRNVEHASQLRFGDFDGDGRADVLALHGTRVDVSWAGVTPWQTINTIGGPLADTAVGDFDGDHRADLFFSNGAQWLVAPAGRGWTTMAASSYLASNLRFGDFTGDGKTDVLGVVAGQWMIVPGGGSTWQRLGNAQTSSMSGLVVADFDGDGIADVGRTLSGSLFTASEWQWAARGTASFVNLRSDAGSLAALPIGRFDVDAKADVLEWSSGRFARSSGATGAPSVVSAQDMR